MCSTTSSNFFAHLFLCLLSSHALLLDKQPLGHLSENPLFQQKIVLKIKQASTGKQTETPMLLLDSIPRSINQHGKCWE
jgi:hypothetical protein